MSIEFGGRPVAGTNPVQTILQTVGRWLSVGQSDASFSANVYSGLLVFILTEIYSSLSLSLSTEAV